MFVQSLLYWYVLMFTWCSYVVDGGKTQRAVLDYHTWFGAALFAPAMNTDPQLCTNNSTLIINMTELYTVRGRKV